MQGLEGLELVYPLMVLYTAMLAEFMCVIITIIASATSWIWASIQQQQVAMAMALMVE
jgi:hypothetical protein